MKNVKKAVVLMTVLCLCVGLLSGCGDKKAETPKPGKSEKPVETATPEYIYVAEYVPLDAELENSINSLCRVGDKFLFSSYGIIADNTPEGVVPEFEGQYAVYGNSLYWMTVDGKTTRLENYVPFSPDGQEVNVTDFETGSYCYSSIQSIVAVPGGGIATLDNVYQSAYDGPDDAPEYGSEEWYDGGYYEYMTSEESYYLRYLNEDGSEMSYVNLTEALSAAIGEMEYFYLSNLVVDGNGTIYLVSDGVIFAIDGKGTLLFKIEFENWIESIFIAPDGRVAVGYYGDNGCEIGFVDPQACAITDAVECVVTDMYGMVAGGGEYDLYYNNGSNFFGYNLATNEATKLFNWFNCDIDVNNINTSTMAVLDDGRIMFVESIWDDTTHNVDVSLVLMSKQPYSSRPQRTTLTLACQYLDYELRSEIIKFNKNNPDYRIEVLDYSEYNTSDDYGAGLTKLTTEIMAGNVPDILDLDGLPVEQMIAKGLLEDLYPYIDSDPELSRDQFFPSVLSALEVDGKLYSTVSSFSISTAIGASSVVGDEPGWNFEEFNAALRSMPDGCEPFDRGVVRDDILYYCLNHDMSTLVDWNTGECRFNTPDFIEILKFAAMFPEEFDWENVEWLPEDEADARIAAGRQMLMMTHVYDFQSSQMYRAMFGGDITYIGFPTASGVGNALSIDGAGCAISSKCADKNAAWQFVRTVMTEKYQERNSWNFPANIAAFNKMLESAMTPIWKTDENGNFILDENGNRIEEPQGTWGWGNIEVEIMAVTQEEADQILDLINSTTRVMKYDEEIIEIVREEAAAFFAGQKTAEDVARLIQSKVNIVVNEKR